MEILNTDWDCFPPSDPMYGYVKLFIGGERLVHRTLFRRRTMDLGISPPVNLYMDVVM